LALQDADGAYTSAHGALATLIGLPPTATFEVDTTAANAPVASMADVVDTLIAHALADRPDLAAERAQVDVRRAQARVAASQRKPSLTATGTASSTYLSGTSGGKNSYNVGLSFAIPLFNGFGWEYAARAASLTADAEAARLKSLEQQVALQVFQTYQELRTATLRVAAADDLFTSASAAADVARGRYRAGAGSLLELLTAEQSLANARSERVQARVEWHTSLVQLAHDAGVLDASGTNRLKLTPSTPGSNQ
jgi:outer membrane protein TolC